MRRIKLFSLIQERVSRRMCPSRWSARRRASWSASGGSAAVESLEPRYLLSAGDLDPSFGVGGKVTTSFETNTAIAQGMAIQNDGKVVIAGTNNGNAFLLARYNTDGSLDSSFDGDGKVTTNFNPLGAGAQSVAIQSDGKIVAAGSVSNEFALARYNNDGSLDTAFDGDGILTTDFGGLGATANSLVLQADGKIVLAGTTNIDGESQRIAVARYNSDGSLDSSFGNSGKVTTSVGTEDRAFGYGAAVQTDGKIVVLGQTINHNGYDFAVVRYDSDGLLDTAITGRILERCCGSFMNGFSDK